MRPRGTAPAPAARLPRSQPAGRLPTPLWQSSRHPATQAPAGPACLHCIPQRLSASARRRRGSLCGRGAPQPAPAQPTAPPRGLTPPAFPAHRQLEVGDLLHAAALQGGDDGAWGALDQLLHAGPAGRAWPPRGTTAPPVARRQAAPLSAPRCRRPPLLSLLASRHCLTRCRGARPRESASCSSEKIWARCTPLSGDTRLAVSDAFGWRRGCRSGGQPLPQPVPPFDCTRGTLLQQWDCRECSVSPSVGVVQPIQVRHPRLKLPSPEFQNCPCGALPILMAPDLATCTPIAQQTPSIAVYLLSSAP